MFQNSQLIPSYHLSQEKIKEIVASVNASKAQFIYGYSSTISLMADYCISKNVRIRKTIKAIFTSSDMLYPNQRKNIEQVFHAEVFEFMVVRTGV